MHNNGHTRTAVRPPETRRTDICDHLHGVSVADPYRWLEDQESRETRAWIDAQNRYADSLIGNLEIRSTIATRMEQLLRVDAISFPTEHGGRYFFARRRPEDEQAILYVRDGLGETERVFVDPSTLGLGDLVSVDYRDITHDGALAAYSIRKGGDDQVEIRIRDTVTLQDLPDRLPEDYNSSISFKHDKSGLYYTRLTPLVGRRVYYHAMGTESDQDIEIFGGAYGPEAMVGGTVSENGRWLLLYVYHGWARNDLFLQDLAAGGPIIPLVQRVDATFNAEFADDTLVVQTDWKAPSRRILTVDLNLASVQSHASDIPPEQQLAGWREIVPAGPDPIESFSVAGGRIFLQYLHNVTTLIKSYDLDGVLHGELELPGIGSATTPYGRWDSDEAFYTFESFTVPTAIYRYEISTGEATLWAQPKVPIDADQFETRQIWFASKDGTQVPMFLVSRKGLEWDGARPTLLSGYGGFNVSLTPYFAATAVLLAERGGIFALANLRGGGEFGEDWHRAGMKEHKQNVFDDFIASSEWLIANGATNPDRLAIGGGSNGGLLVGTALTQHPELFRAVFCSYPLLDMVRYHLFLQGPQWIPEYGTAEDPEQFNTLFAYSPYHHVRPGTTYPATLFVTGDVDTRVAPLHARKMAALLQAAQSPDATDRPVLLHYDTEAGHSGGEPTAKQIERQSFIYAFLFQQLGLAG